MTDFLNTTFGITRKPIMRFAAFLFFLLSMALTATPAASQVPWPEHRPDTDRYPLNLHFEIAETPPQPLYGYVPPTVDLSHLTAIQPAGVRSTKLPTQFDWRDQGKVTPVRNQDPCGTCWIFGTMASLESTVLMKEGTAYDFSEQSVALCVDRSWTDLYDEPDDPCDAGGNSILAAEVLIKKGAVSETCAPYDTGDLRCDGSCACDTCAPIKRVDGYRLVTDDAADIDVVKNALLDHGPLIASFHHNSACQYVDSEWGTIYDCYPSPPQVNHCISLVGWNDAVPHPNPNHPGTGAWLVKNSWGEGHGDAGYAYLAYNSSRTVEVAYLQYGDHDPSEELLYWDEAGFVYFLPALDSTAWMASVFQTAQAQLLTRVEFWTTSNSAEYVIYVWNERFGSELARQSGTTEEFGYYSVAIKPPVPLDVGQDFTIGVRMRTPGFPNPLAAEGPYEAAGIDPPIQSNVSFFREADWVPWRDLSEVGRNGCLRARLSDDLSNRAPVISGVPDLTVPMDAAAENATDLWAYADDREDGDADLTFRVSNVPSAGAGVSVDGRYLAVMPTAGFTGTTEVRVEVQDTAGLTDTDSLVVTIEAVQKPRVVYLPLITKMNLRNGDFEDGSSGWRTYSTHGRDVISTELPAGVTPHGGRWAAWLGDANKEESYIEQAVTVPAERPHLIYWQWIDSPDVCGFDLAGANVDGAVVDQYDLCEAENTGGWVKHAVDLSDYAGKPIELRIWVRTDDWLESNLFVDDVAFTTPDAVANDQTVRPLLLPLALTGGR